MKEAANAVGKGKSTLQRAIKAGKLSAQISDKGTYRIDPAELARVYPEDFSTDPSKRNGAKRCNPSQRDAMEHNETALLRLELNQIKEQLAQHRRLSDREIEQATATIEDLRKRLDQADREKSTLTHLLEYKSKAGLGPRAKPGLLSRLFG
ncbi:MAG: hypothetical protein AAGA72_00435 [Pseudomonadota bacterium]